MTVKNKHNDDDAEFEDEELEDEESEDESEGEDAEENEEDEDESGDEDGDEGDEDLVDQIVDQLEERLADRFDSVADRRVNALLKEIRKQGGGEPPKKPKKSDDGGDTSRGDVRAARIAAREYLADEIDFVSREERRMAMDLVGQRIASRDVIDDEDEVGSEVAEEVAEQIRSMRSMYGTEKKRRRKAPAKKGQPKKGGSGTSQQSEFEKGREIAARMRPTEQVS